jgi:hypothetical protein
MESALHGFILAGKFAGSNFVDCGLAEDFRAGKIPQRHWLAPGTIMEA